MAEKIRVLVADDQAALREELLSVLSAQPDMEVVATIEEGAEIVFRASEVAPDVVLIDLSISGGGLRVLEQLAEKCPATKTVVLAMHDEISLLRSVLAVSSLGYVVHRTNHREILSVIRKIHSGRGYVEVPTGGLTIEAAPDPRSPRGRELLEKLEQLSKREREVLRAVAYGFINREIADRLGISVKSIETYRYRVAEKLGFGNRADLVRFALEAGLLRPGIDGLPEGEA